MRGGYNMIIKILGTGCPNCKRLEKNLKEALEDSSKPITIEKVTDINDIMTYNIMSTPALVVDEKLLFAGQVPNVSKLQELLS